MNVILFGDQTADPQQFLTKVLRRKGSPLLSSFLEQAQVVLQEEVSSQSPSHRRELPAFSNIAELVERYYKADRPNIAIESTVTCLAQLVHFIGYYEQYPLEYPRSASSQILGICTGLLSASVAASSNSLSSFVPLAVQAVRIAFRTGSRVSTIAEQLERTTDQSKTWSTVVVGITRDDAEIALAEFNRAHGLSKSKCLYTSAVGSMSVTISGPPSVRDRLFDTSLPFQNLQRREIPIKGPYHAAHLYNALDVDRIIDADIASRLEKYSVIHPVTGMSQSGSTLELFQDCIRDILCNQVQWEAQVKACVAAVRSSSASGVRVLAMGPTALANPLVSALKVGGGLSIILEDGVSFLAQNRLPKAPMGELRNSKIAIIGMAGRFPNAADHEAFWDLLVQGLDVHREIPGDRFDAQAHCDPTGKGRNKSHTPYGCFIDSPGLFDPRFFNMSPREATKTDPMQRLALSTAYEAMEQSGFVSDRTPSTMKHRVATYYGQTSDDWREINAAQDIDTYFITGGVRAFGPGRINYHFGFSGPSFSVDTACSSSFAAIQLACTSLRAGECDTAFTGGMNILSNPDIFSGLSKGQFLSKTGSCKTYDAGADGYCRGDGVVTLILKRLDDAIAENDPILGVINGIATNHSAEAVSITHPHAGAQKFLFQKVMDEAEVDVRSVNYVEMHGTGTQAGDGVEMDSVSSVFAPTAASKRMRGKDQPLFVGSVKSNIGHGEAVSGACAMVKVLMMFQKNLIPPHCGVKTSINPAFPKDLKERSLDIAFKPTPFVRSAESPRYVFINNFSAAGGNTALLLEDAPRKPLLKIDPRSSHLVIITAKSLSSFKQNAKRLLAWASDKNDSILPSLAYTTTARRNHYPYRLAFEANTMSHVRNTLGPLIEASRAPISSSKKPSVAFSFTGQGSHYLGMGKTLFEDVPQFRRDIEDFDQIATSHDFPSFIGLIDGSIADLATVSPVVTQLAIACLEMAIAKLWDSWGVKPSVVIGHSLGEYAALQVAGVISVVDTILLVGHRAQLLVSKCAMGSHGMLAVRASLSTIEPMISHIPVEKACHNGPEDLVFSGTVDSIEQLRETLTAAGFKATKLNVPYAFHSAQVDPILEDFKQLAKAIVFHQPRVPVISTCLGSVVSQSDIFGPEYLARHCRESVNFFGGISSALDSGFISSESAWIEVGPHPICSNMVKSTLGKETTAVPSLNRNDNPWKTLSSSLSSLFNMGVRIDWSEYHRDFSQSHEVLPLPSYAYDDKNYWIDYVGNWTLTKGDTFKAAPPVKPKFSTTSIQKITHEQIDFDSAVVTAESDLAEPLLRAVVEGHSVAGAGLCPSTLLADMAMTLCDYAYKTARPDAPKPYVNIMNMENHKTLILNVTKSSPSQIVRVEAKLDFASGKGEMFFRAVGSDGSLVDHSRCDINYEDPAAWTKEWERQKFLVQTRVDMLKNGGKGIHTVQRGLAYKLFSALVTYDDKFRGMEEVILNSDALEATSVVNFQASSKDGNFFMSPYFIDSVCHITGFIMNANDAVDSKKQVYISHGWETLRFAKPLEADKQYRSYCRMQPVAGAGKMVAGDVYVFEGDDIIGVAGGVRFQCVPRALLDTLLSPAKSKADSTPTMPAPVSKVKQQTVPKTRTSTKSRISAAAEKLSSAQAVKATKESEAKNLEVVVTSNLVAKAMQIIADEVGCEMSELADPIELSDLGVDSLMALTISGRFREELELDFSSTVFNDLSTISHLKSHLRQFESVSESSAGSSGMSTPDMVDSDTSDSEYSYNSDNEAMIEELNENDESEESDLIHTIRSTIAEEMGVELEEITDNTDLATMGMDSLMSLSILGALREKTGLTMNSDLLVSNTSIDMIETSLGLRKAKSQVASLALNPSVLKASVPLPMPTPKAERFSTASYPPASSILLQGNPRTAQHTLFLLPDGSGSATSYAPIPDIAASDLIVYGLNCPFMKTPEDFTIGVAAVCQIYMAEIQRRQPKGPYKLGGWSAGGVLAYEMTRQFIRKGETVERLLLIDSPCPVKLEALPSSFHRYCDKIGLLGKPGAKIPSWLLPHFASAVRELTNYSDSLGDANDIDVSKMPPTTAIWARDGIVHLETDPKPEWDPAVPMPNSMDWLTHNRTDLGPNGWEKLVGAENIECQSTAGNHFTMMRQPVTAELAALMKAALKL
ncbi:polyketide synthase [Drepanopeziza brunnea f. sp. 'multigermtubi' MB_m1]|uniref:Polyketide synthase n=1 Tax=Marssonina brunnea f. sp. multigermtubi (strain MB_m1) TaxID=1072389 RepID=K1WM58_MARBU|nr:polyketide synthase [Drepanopeziza brunnea f. sp. 'multigermtubi' MB_m1]EKD13976.1 polyketide synthase [Drepanopeziza brunnea f. sp. 'multigermtubi' MB_m1]